MNSEEQEQQIVISLAEEQDALWRKFAALGNEMVVNTIGRPIYPKLEYRIKGLAPLKSYAIALEFYRVDDYCYKFSDGKWDKDGKSYVSCAEANRKVKKIWHPSGARAGMQWNAFPVNFDAVMITSNPEDTRTNSVFLCAMCKYIPILSVYAMPSHTLAPVWPSELVALHKLDYTEFIAVRKYQNDAVASLKFDFDPWWGAIPFRKLTRRQPLKPVVSKSQPKRKKCEVSTKASTSAGIPPSLAPVPVPIRRQALAPLPAPITQQPPVMLPAQFPALSFFPQHFVPNPFMVPTSTVYSPFYAQAAMMANPSFFPFSGFPYSSFGSPNYNFAFSSADSEPKDVSKP